MIEHLSALELGGIASKGASLEVNGAQFSAEELGGIAARLTDNATIKIFCSSTKTALELGAIAASKPGQVIFA